MKYLFSQITTTNLILWLCVIWIPALIGFVLNLETKGKNDSLLGIHIPKEAQKDEEILLLLSLFRKNLLFTCAGITLLALPCCLMQRTGNAMTIWMIWILLCVIVPYLPYIHYHKKLKQLKEQRGWESIEEDDYWIWGIFYYNPDDKRSFITNRNGMNSTVNLAKRSGKILIGVTAIVLLCMPFFGVWLDHMETTPVGLTIHAETVVSTHTGVEYQIPINTITSIEYVPEKPKLKRSAGTAMDSVQKGRYGTPWGAASICLDPRTAPYLYLETEDGKRYLFGSSDAAETECVYQQLMHIQNNKDSFIDNIK